jgi:S-adenosylmethionine decarboxylase proenzyme
MDGTLIEARDIGSNAAADLSPPLSTIGTQVVLDLYECASDELDNIDWVNATMIEAARVAGATIIDVVFHKFSPWGISGVVVISESHLAIHIWPERSYAAIDVFTCGNSVDLDRAVRYLVEAFKSGRSSSHRIIRGKDI